ncbi:MAG: hypothetical protein JSV80_18160 [Acidobacteriota bacterium]|nr:MAG: hypothetical protein JSV80_18160 [Acidobacteriota bacterium]
MRRLERLGTGSDPTQQFRTGLLVEPFERFFVDVGFRMPVYDLEDGDGLTPFIHRDDRQEGIGVLVVYR